MNIRLMIADDHVAIRAGVISLIQGTEIEMVCQAETCEDTIKHVLAYRPDVLLLDIRLGGSDGLIALEQINRENYATAVIIFSAIEEVKEMARARQLGAQGFLFKGTTREDLLDCIRRAATGKKVWTPRQIRQVVSRAATAALVSGDRNPLSSREIEVLKKIITGQSNEAISEDLRIDIETVKQHVKHILRKLHVEDRTQAALISLRSKLYDEGPAFDLQVPRVSASPLVNASSF